MLGSIAGGLVLTFGNYLILSAPWKDLFLSARSFLNYLFFTFPWKKVFSWSVLIPMFIIWVIWISVTFFWVRSFVRYINRLLVHIRNTGLLFLSEPFFNFSKVEKSDYSFQGKIERILMMCVATVGLKPRFIRKKASIFAAVYLYENGGLILNSFYDTKGRFGLKKGDKIISKEYFFSWVLDEKRTREFNKKSGYDSLGGDFVFVEDLEIDNEIVPEGFRPLSSGISVALKFQENVIGVLVVGTDEKYYLGREDVFALAIIAQYLTASLAAHVSFPGHPKNNK
jgi:hypothetical protein